MKINYVITKQEKLWYFITSLNQFLWQIYGDQREDFAYAYWA